MPVERDVLRGIRVELLLRVSPSADANRTAVAEVVAPLGAVDARTRGTIELLAPDKHPRARHTRRIWTGTGRSTSHHAACHEHANARRGSASVHTHSTANLHWR